MYRMRSDFIPRAINDACVAKDPRHHHQDPSSPRAVSFVTGTKKKCPVCEMENRMKAVNCAFCTSALALFCVCGEDIEYAMPFCDVCSAPNPQYQVTGKKLSASEDSF